MTIFIVLSSWSLKVIARVHSIVPDLQSGVAGSNLSLGYFAPRSTQPSIPPGSANEYQLRLGRQRQVWLIQIADERVGVQVKLWNPLRTRAIPERFCGADSLLREALYQVYAPLSLPLQLETLLFERSFTAAPDQSDIFSLLRYSNVLSVFVFVL